MLKVDIQDKLTEKKLNKNQFSKLVKVGYPAACALYDGTTSRISFDTLENICIALECTPNDILVSDNPQLQNIIDSQKKSNINKHDSFK